MATNDKKSGKKSNSEPTSDGQVRVDEAARLGDTAVAGRTNGDIPEGVTAKQRATQIQKAAEEKKDYLLSEQVTIDGKQVPAGNTVSLTETGRRYFKNNRYIK